MIELRKIIVKHTSEMLDSPDENGIYPTTKFYEELETEIEAQIQRLITEARIDEARYIDEYIIGSPRKVTVNDKIKARIQELSITNKGGDV